MNPLHLAPPKATPIGGSDFSFLQADGKVYYFKYLDPIDFHDAVDRKARNVRIGRFGVLGVRRIDLARSFGLNESTICESTLLYREGGEEAFYRDRRIQGPRAIDDKAARKAEQLLSAGLSQREAAGQLGIAVRTFNLNCRKGYISVPVAGDDGKPESGGVPVETGTADVVATEERQPGTRVDRSAREERDRGTAMGRATHNTAGRVMSSMMSITN